MIRTDFSNDTVVSPFRGTQKSAKEGRAAVGNKDFGYFAGGNPATSEIERLDYASDSATMVVRGTLDNISPSAFNKSASGNASYGYVSGGPGWPSAAQTFVQRVDYANDTAEALQKGPLAAGRYRHGATGSRNFGYHGGGFDPASPGQRSDISRIDYSNDTATATPKYP